MGASPSTLFVGLVGAVLLYLAAVAPPFALVFSVSLAVGFAFGWPLCYLVKSYVRESQSRVCALLWAPVLLALTALAALWHSFLGDGDAGLYDMSGLIYCFLLPCAVCVGLGARCAAPLALSPCADVCVATLCAMCSVQSPSVGVKRKTSIGELV